MESFSISGAAAADGGFGAGELCGAALEATAVGAEAVAVAVAMAGRGASVEATGALVSFMGVRIAVKAVALLGSGAGMGADPGNCVGPPSVELAAPDEGAFGKGAGAAVVATGAIIAAKVDRSAVLRGCLTGNGATGVDEEATDTNDAVPSGDCISVLSSGAAGFFESSSL